MSHWHLCDVQSIDVVSFYLYVIMNRRYPYVTKICSLDGDTWNIWKDLISKCSTFDISKIDVYKVVVHSQSKNKIILYCNEDGTLDWHYHEEFTYLSGSISLNLLNKYGGKFTTKQVFIYNMKMVPIFKDNSFFNISFLDKEKVSKNNFYLI